VYLSRFEVVTAMLVKIQFFSGVEPYSIHHQIQRNVPKDFNLEECEHFKEASRKMVLKQYISHAPPVTKRLFDD
jgi:hypothetical protein